MIWDSIFLMTAIDLTVISGFIFSLIYFHEKNPNFTWKRPKRGFLILFIGLGIIALFFLGELYSMHILPFIIPEMEAMEFMKSLHGEYMWFIIPPGVLLLIIGLVLVITNYGQNVSLLEESQKQFRMLAENANDIITLRDANTKVLYVSPSYEKHLGRSMAKYLGTTFETIPLHPEDQLLFKTWKTEVFKKGKPFIGVFRVKAKSGKYIWFESKTEPIKDEKGKLTGAVTISRNFSKQKEEEDRGIQLGRILDNSSVEIYISDLETQRFVFANQAATKNIGYSLAELKKMTPLDISTNLKNQPELLDSRLKPLIAGKKDDIWFETPHLRKDGTTYDAAVTLQLSELDNKLVVVANVEDNTDWNINANKLRQSQKMEAVGQLTGGIAHDFNNLLTAMQGGIRLAEMEELSDAAREYLGISMDAVKRGADLSQRLLAFSRTQALKQEVVELNDLVKGFEPLLRRTLSEYIKIETVFMKKKGFIKVDAAELENSILNLSVNARDAMADGGLLTLKIEKCRVAGNEADQKEIKPGSYITISVSDTGSGMPPEIRDHIFEPFFTTKEKGKGTGLGLSSVYGFVKQSEGHLTVHSKVDIGTTFKLYFPETKK